MKSTKLRTFAADAPAASAAPVTASAAVIAANLNLPTVGILKSAGQNRAEVKAEVVEFVKNHKTGFAVQLDQYKN